MTPIDSVGRHGTRQAGILASVSSCHWRRILSLSGGIRWCRLQRKRGEFRRTSSSKPAAKEFSLFLTVRTNQARIPLCEHTRRLDHRLKDDSKMFRHTSLSHMEQHLRVRDHPYSEKATSLSTARLSLTHTESTRGAPQAAARRGIHTRLWAPRARRRCRADGKTIRRKATRDSVPTHHHHRQSCSGAGRSCRWPVCVMLDLFQIHYD